SLGLNRRGAVYGRGGAGGGRRADPALGRIALGPTAARRGRRRGSRPAAPFGDHFSFFCPWRLPILTRLAAPRPRALPQWFHFWIQKSSTRKVRPMRRPVCTRPALRLQRAKDCANN